MIRSAPIAAAVRIGVLPAIAPSISSRPITSTGGNATGIAALASTASAAGPDERLTAAPERSVATTLTGRAASSSRVNGKCISTIRRRPEAPNRLPRPRRNSSTLPGVTGNTSGRVSPRQIASSAATPAASGRPAK